MEPFTTTNLTAARLRPGTSDRYVMDPTAKGFGVRVTKRGARTWIHRYRDAGKLRTVTLGRFPRDPRHPAPDETTLPDARTRYAESQAARSRGERWTGPGAGSMADRIRDAVASAGPGSAADAEAERRHRHPGPSASAVAIPTFRALASAYLADIERAANASGDPPRTGKHKTAIERRSAITLHLLPDLGGYPLDCLGDRLRRVVKRLEREGKARTAKWVRGTVSVMWTFGLDAEIIPAGVRSPIEGIPAPKVQSRQGHALTREELPRFLRALSKPWTGPYASADYWRDIFRVQLLTASRIGMVCGMRWDEIRDLDGERPVWAFEAARPGRRGARQTKNRTAHVIPLAPSVVAILRERKNRTPFVFAAPTASGHARHDQAGKMLERVLARMEGEAPAIVSHDLRRTASSYLEIMGATPDDRAGVLNHSRPGMDGVYTLTLAGLDGARRVFLETWAELCESAETNGARWRSLDRIIEEAARRKLRV